MEALLPEIWLEVLSLLPPRDLCSMALVCSQARELATWPSLWTKASLKKLMFHVWRVKGFLDIPRYSRVHRLDFTRLQLTPEEGTLLLRWLLTSPLTSLNLYGTDLSSVPPDLLSPALHHLTHINLGFTKLTSAQCCHLFSYLENNPPTKVTELSLKAIRLSAVSPSMLASTISQMEVANLAFTELTSGQLSAILKQLVLPTSKLKSLELFSVDLSETRPELLGAAVARLRIANLSNTELRPQHVLAIFQDITRSETIKEINLDFAELFEVPPSLFSFLARLTRVSLACTVLNPPQVEAMFREVSSSYSRLQDLDLLDTQLLEVPGDILAAASSRLSRLNLSGSKLSPRQVDTLLGQLDLKLLKEINLDYVDLSGVSATNLARVISSTEKASLKKTSLLTEAVTAILEGLTNATFLTSLTLHGVNMSEVSPSLLASSIPFLCYADLSHTSLNTQTTSCLFSSLAEQNPSLEDLTLIGNNLSDIALPLLAGVVRCGLLRLDLSTTHLTKDQVDVLVPSLGSPLQEVSLFGVELDTLDPRELEMANQRVFMNYRRT